MKLAHYSVRTRDLAASEKFYTEVLRMRVGGRPKFKFPGIWLYLSEDESDLGVVHIIGVDDEHEAALTEYLGTKDADTLGSGALDHIAFFADDFDEYLSRFERLGVEFTERLIPSMELKQLFISDPSGITIELNFYS